MVRQTGAVSSHRALRHREKAYQDERASSKAPLRRIEMPSEELAVELQKHLKDESILFTSYDRGRRAIQFPDDIDPAVWSTIKSTVERWAEPRHLDVVESLRLQPKKPETNPETRAENAKLEAEVNKRLEGLSPDKAEARYNYLSSKPISELTDAEVEERLRLAQRTFGKPRDQKK